MGKDRDRSSKGLRIRSKDSQLGLGQKTARGLGPGSGWGSCHYSDGKLGEKEEQSGVCAVKRSKIVRSSLM